jgi:NADPH:quinone reductase-like Zn-dependent oxidoreductase
MYWRTFHPEALCMNLPTTMKALILDGAHAPLRLADRPVPVPADHEVLVRVSASGANPLDLKIRAGAAPHAKHPFPAILGIDLAGVVAAVGKHVTAFSIGDEVFGMTGGVGGRQGSLAQFAAVDARLLAHKSGKLTMRQAAAIPLAFITAWEGLVDRARVKEGQQVLIHGGAGGVGHMAIQIASAFGAETFSTVSAANAEYVAGLGAIPIDYKTKSVDSYVAEHTLGNGFDIVYDTAGGHVLDASFQAVKRFGHVVSALGWGTHALAPLSFKGATYSGVFTLLPLLTGLGREHHGEILREATRLADSGQLKPRIDSQTYTLETANDAHAAMAGSATSGKVVITLDADYP